MKTLSGFVTGLMLSIFMAVVPLAALQPGQPPVEGFEPIDKLPPAEQLPAAPLLVAAYAFAWVAVFFYLWTVWRRLNKVETEMHTLEKRQRSISQIGQQCARGRLPAGKGRVAKQGIDECAQPHGNHPGISQFGLVIAHPDRHI